MHSVSVWSQLVTQVNVSSTHTSLQTSFSSKSLENIMWFYFIWNQTILTDNLDPLFGLIGVKRLGPVVIKPLLSFWLFEIWNSLLFLKQLLFSQTESNTWFVFVEKQVSFRNKMKTFWSVSVNVSRTYFQPWFSSLEVLLITDWLLRCWLWVLEITMPQISLSSRQCQL